MTVQKKLLGKKTTISIDGEIYGRVENLTPPGLSAPVIEGEELNPTDDAGTEVSAEIRLLGDEEVSEVNFMHYYQPGHAQATLLETMFTNRSEETGKKPCVITYPNAQTKTFDVRVKSLSVEQISKNGWLKRSVTLLRVSDIT
jgi:hypothetical protein